MLIGSVVLLFGVLSLGLGAGLLMMTQTVREDRGEEF